MSTKSDINLWAMLNERPRNRVNKGKMVAYLSIAFVVLANVLVYGYFYISKIAKTNGINDMNNFLNSPEVMSVLERDAELSKNIEAAKKDIVLYDAMGTYVNSRTGYTTDVYQVFLSVKPVDVFISSFSFNADKIEINCYTLGEDPSADYAKALEGTGIFEYVSYSGFSSRGTDGVGVTFPISCKLKAVSAND